MTSDEYMKAALVSWSKDEHFITHGPGGDSQLLTYLVHALMGMQTESAEFTDMIKKCLIYGKPIDEVNLLEELGDIAWYMNLALNKLGYTWVDMFDRNIAKLKVRFPDKFTPEKALTRDLEAERKALEDDK